MIEAQTLCQSCGNQGPYPLATGLAPTPQPSWCTCKRNGPGLLPGGPFVAAPGAVVQFAFDTPEDRAFAERCRVAGNEYVDARDAAITAKWTPCGKIRPRTGAIRKAAERKYRNALRALTRLQSQCRHWRVSIFEPTTCGVCGADLRPSNHSD
jgi:hypothetical protein